MDVYLAHHDSYFTVVPSDECMVWMSCNMVKCFLVVSTLCSLVRGALLSGDGHYETVHYYKYIILLDGDCQITNTKMPSGIFVLIHHFQSQQVGMKSEPGGFGNGELAQICCLAFLVLSLLWCIHVQYMCFFPPVHVYLCATTSRCSTL